MSISKRLRFAVFNRDGFACVYCGRRAPGVTLEADHRIPRCKGGTDALDNLVAACWDCNRGKGPVLIDEQSEDYEPSYYDHISGHCNWLKTHYPESLYDELPDWMLPPRLPRYNLRLSIEDILEIASGLPVPPTWPLIDEEPF